jgi:hypothetical protein
MYKYRVCILCTNGETDILDWETEMPTLEDTISEIMREPWIATICSIKLK